MKKRITLVVLGIFLIQNSIGQIKNDSVSETIRLVPRFGVNIQRGFGVECGLMVNKFLIEVPEHSKTLLGYTSSGFYISSELSFRNLDKMIIGPKVGWEMSGIGETSGSCLGAEFIYYTNIDKNSPALMVKLGLPLLWLNVGYGYTMYLDKANSFRTEIGKHRLTVSYIINRTAKREFKRLKENLMKSSK